MVNKDIKNEIEQLIIDVKNLAYELGYGFNRRGLQSVIEASKEALDSEDYKLLKETKKKLVEWKRDLEEFYDPNLYYERKKKGKIIKNSIKIGAGIIAVLGIGVSCGKFVKYEKDTWYEKPSHYYEYTLVEYNGSQYKLNSLYKLTSESDCYICKKVEKSHTESRWAPAITQNGYKMAFTTYTVDDPDVYVDIKTNQEVCVEGYESIFGVEVEKLSDYFTFEEYGTEGAENNTKTIITEDQVNSVIYGKNSISK